MKQLRVKEKGEVRFLLKLFFVLVYLLLLFNFILLYNKNTKDQVRDAIGFENEFQFFSHW